MMKYPLNKWALKRLGIIPVFFLSQFSGSFAQQYNTDATSIALAGCYSSGSGGSSRIYNEALLGHSRSEVYHISHARPFVIKELGISSLGAQFPLFPGSMHVELQHYGVPGYQQINSSLGYGMKLSESIFAGLGFRYYNTMTLGKWNYLQALGVSGGILIKTGKSTYFGAHIVNPVTINNYADYGVIFPSLITLGLRSEIYAASFVLGEISYHSTSGLESRIALEYHSSETITIRAGYHSNPATLSFGTGFLLSPMKLDIAFAYSLRYGIIPALTIAYLHGK